MDPIASIDIRADTTFVLMLEAQRRGHRVLYVDPADLGVDDGRVPRACARVTLRRERGPPRDLGEPRTSSPRRRRRRRVPAQGSARRRGVRDRDADPLAVPARARAEPARPGILAANEKLYALHFPELMPETRVTRSIRELVDFLAKLGGEMIVKPLDGRGGEGVFHVRNDDRNLFSILEQSTRFGTRRAMAQRYLPDGAPGRQAHPARSTASRSARCCACPRQSERARTSTSAARAARTRARRRATAASSSASRRGSARDGLFFVGIDVIGGRLTEVNVTSPTGIQEMDASTASPRGARCIDRGRGQARGPRRGRGQSESQLRR